MATAVLVAGLGFGDEGKGSIVDYLCAQRDAKLVVRYNGGPQAAHNVVTPMGQHHTFSQIGSGFFQGAQTYLSKFMLVDLFALVAEIYELEKLGIAISPDNFRIDKEATIVTPYHRAANRIQERLRGDSPHGSCGVGVGEARRDEISGLNMTALDLIVSTSVESFLVDIREQKLEELPDGWRERADPDDLHIMDTDPRIWTEQYEKIYLSRLQPCLADQSFLKKPLRDGTVIFEGAQGVLLDEDYGFFPYNSWTKTTFENADTILKELGFNGLIERCGVTRTYMTRHGVGPFPTESRMSVHYDSETKVEHNKLDPWQGEFRTGHLDLVLLRYAVEACGGIDYLALTHTDCEPGQMCWGYEGDLPEKFFTNGARMLPEKRVPVEMEKLTDLLFKVKPLLDNYSVEAIERNLNAPVKIESYGPSCRGKRVR